jgi:hypothetical protein
MPVGLAAALPATKQATAAAAAIRRRDRHGRAWRRRETTPPAFQYLLEDMSVLGVMSSISQSQHGMQALIAFLLRIRGAHDAAVIHLQAQKPSTREAKPDTRAVH